MVDAITSFAKFVFAANLVQSENLTLIKPVINIKRVYEKPSKKDGLRILVDRLWPRGLTKAAAEIDEWAKAISPTTALRKWYNHEPERLKEFEKLYENELDENVETQEFIHQHKNEKIITLLFAGKEPKYSHAVVLRNYLAKHFSKD